LAVLSACMAAALSLLLVAAACAAPEADPAPLPKQPPLLMRPILPADRSSPRRLLVDQLHGAVAAGSYDAAARINAVLGQEAYVRARRVLDAWETLRGPATGLIPKSPVAHMRYWNSEDVGADLFPYLLYAAHELDAGGVQPWLDTMAAERRICGRLPCQIALPSGIRIERRLEADIFGAVEYSKDGLLAVAERLGRGPWLDRMIEDIDAVLEAAPVETPRGRLASDGTEVNGELLIVLSRLWLATRDEKYIAAAERIADAYLFDVMPKNHGLPARLWHFPTMRPASAEFRLRDHGSELVPGLGELYLVEKLSGRAAAQRYREPIRHFLDAVLRLPRTSDGMFHDSYDAASRNPIDADVADTWGYVLTGYHAFDLAEGTDVYGAEIERIMRAAATRRSFEWEWRYMDGYADTLESMLYMLPFRPIAECMRWVDDEIEVLFGKQHDDGFVERWYLDGNFIRTAMLYAHYKSLGVRAVPWNEDVAVGASMNPQTRELFVHVQAGRPWSGRIVLDVPRHARTWNLPKEYPRLNGLPQWFVVETERSYLVTDAATGTSVTRSAKELEAGLDVSLPAPAAVRLRIQPQG